MIKIFLNNQYLLISLYQLFKISIFWTLFVYSAHLLFLSGEIKIYCIGYLWFNNKNIFKQSIFTYLFISIIQNFDIWTLFVYIWVRFVGFLIFIRLFSKMEWKTSKKGPTVFQLKMRQKHWLWVILIKFG